MDKIEEVGLNATSRLEYSKANKQEWLIITNFSAGVVVRYELTSENKLSLLRLMLENADSAGLGDVIKEALGKT